MNTKELLEKIARYKSAMEAETDVDTKKKFQSRIDQLEKDIAQVEAAVEKKEEKIEKQEDKALEEAEKKLRRYKDAMDAETDPDTKAKFQKRIDDLEKQLKGVKEQIKEEKKEIEEQKKDIKDAVQDVQSAQKAVRTQAIKKAGKQVAARKTTATQKKTRKKTIANIISKLDKLIDKNPALKAKYKGARGGSYMQYPSVDLKRDASRASKPFGYRFKGEGNNRVPRPDQRNQSNVYYEGRANRADVYPRRKYKLEDGGEIPYGVYFSLEDYRKFKNGNVNIGDEISMSLSPSYHTISKITSIDKKGKHYGIQTKEGSNYQINWDLGEFLEYQNKRIKDGKAHNSWAFYKFIPKGGKVADGGMAGHGEMKKGGKVEDELYVAEFRKGEWTVKDKKNPGANYTLSSKKENAQNVRQRLIDSPSTLKYYRGNEYADGGEAVGGKTYYHVLQEGDQGQIASYGYYNDKDEAEKESTRLQGFYPNSYFYVYSSPSTREPEIVNMAKGGVTENGLAGHGKRMSTGGVVLNIYESGADWKINKPTQREFDDYKSAKRMGEKSGAFEYEILDEITGDVMYSTHSEKMTPSLAYKAGGMVEYVLYGTKVGKKDWQEEVLAVRPYKFEITPELEKVTKKDGYNRLRIAKIDLSTPPDFRKIVKKSIGGEMDGGKTEDDWEVLQVRPRKKKAKTQGYDDRKDESLGMSRGKTASKDLDGTKKEKEKSRRDDAGFEKRPKVVYTWKPEAKQVIESMAKQPKKRGISKSILNKKPSEYYAKKFPELVNVEKQ